MCLYHLIAVIIQALDLIINAFRYRILPLFFSLSLIHLLAFNCNGREENWQTLVHSAHIKSVSPTP